MPNDPEESLLWRDRSTATRRIYCSPELLLWTLSNEAKAEHDRQTGKRPQRTKKKKETLFWVDDAFNPLELERAQRECVAALHEGMTRRSTQATEAAQKAYAKIQAATTQNELQLAIAEAHILLDVGSSLDVYPTPSLYCRWLPQWFPGLYNRFVRIRLSYAFLVALVIMIANFSGLMIESFCSAFTADSAAGRTLGSRNPTRYVFCLLPLVMIIFAWLCEKMGVLALDCWGEPPLTRFQSTLLGCMTRDPTVAPKKWHAITVDTFMLLVMDVIPICTGIWGMIRHGNDADGRGMSGAFWRSYLWSCILMAALGTCIFTAADTCIAFLSVDLLGKMSTETGDAREAQEVYMKALQRHQIMPVNLHWAVNSAFELHKVDKTEKGLQDVKADAIYIPNYYQYWAMPVGLAVWFIAMLTKFETNLLGSIQGDLIAIVLAWVVYTWSRWIALRLPGTIGPTYGAVLVIFASIGIGLVLSKDLKSNSSKDAVAAHIEPIMSASSPFPDMWDNNHSSNYPICAKTWGSTTAPITALDLAALSWIVYEKSCAKMVELLNTTFSPQRTFNFDPRRDCTDYDRAFPRWARYHFPGEGGKPGTHVVAVKGTSTKVDAYMDANLWSTIKVLQSFEFILPVLSILPVDQVQWMISVFHVPGHNKDEQQMFMDFGQFIKSIQATYPGDEVVLTGHSLGGGIAQITASQLEIPALVWSAPGFVYSALRFNVTNRERTSFTMMSAKRNVMVVLPEADVVPRVDQQAGVVQPIECRDEYGNFLGFAAAAKCHSLLRTTCEVWRVCGDPYRRDFRTHGACGPFVNRLELGRYFEKDDVS